MIALQDHAGDARPADPVIPGLPVRGLQEVGGRGSAAVGSQHHPAHTRLGADFSNFEIREFGLPTPGDLLVNYIVRWRSLQRSIRQYT